MGLFTILRFQIWCAAGVNLRGGKTKDGGEIIGASVFYGNSLSESTPVKDSDADKTPSSPIEQLEKDIEVSGIGNCLICLSQICAFGLG